MALSKKHYVTIAAIIKRAGELTQDTVKLPVEYQLGVEDTCIIIAHRLAGFFQEDNPRFDQGRFLEACCKECSDG